MLTEISLRNLPIFLDFSERLPYSLLMATRTAPLADLDNDTAHEILTVALDMCAAITRDYPWARGSDASKRHADIVRDFRTNCLPRFSVVMTATTIALIDAAVNNALVVFAS